MSKQEQIEVSIQTAKKMVAKKDLFLALQQNPNFKKLIEDEYFTQEASRLVLYKATPGAQDPKEQYNIDMRINAIGFLQQFFISIVALGNMSEKKIREDQQELNTLDELDEE